MQFQLPEYIRTFLVNVFGQDFVEWLFPLIKQSNEAGIYVFDVAEVIKRHPNAKDYAIRDAKRKLESAKTGLDRFEEGSASNKFTSYQKGVGMVKPLLKIVAQAVFSPDFLVSEILDTFQSAVASPGFLVWHYHTGERTLVEYVVKDLPNGGIELAYIYLHVKGKKDEGWVYDGSDTNLEYKFKTIKFSNPDSLVQWAGQP